MHIECNSHVNSPQLTGRSAWRCAFLTGDLCRLCSSCCAHAWTGWTCPSRAAGCRECTPASGSWWCGARCCRVPGNRRTLQAGTHIIRHQSSDPGKHDINAMFWKYLCRIPSMVMYTHIDKQKCFLCKQNHKSCYFHFRKFFLQIKQIRLVVYPTVSVSFVCSTTLS